MATFSSAVRSSLRSHHGVIARRLLLTLGATAGEIDHWCRTGQLVRIHNGVFRVGTTPASFRSRCLAACLADAELVIGGASAARRWGFTHTWNHDDPVTAIASHGRRPVRSEVTLRRTNLLGPSDWVTDPDGTRWTSPPRTWFDRAADLDDRRFEGLTEHVIDKHCAVTTLWATGRRMMTRGRPGSARVRRVMSRRQEWQKPAGSTLEHEVLSALEERGVHLVRQFRLELRDKSVIHLDGADPTIKWGIEVDHVTWHGGRHAAQYDKQRDLAAGLLGWEVRRVSDQHWRDDRARLIADLVELYRLAGGRLAR